MQSAEMKIKQMSARFAVKMKSASERRHKIVEESIRDKVVDTNAKIEKARDKQAEKDADLVTLQQKLEDKLTAAQQRKDSLITAKVTKSNKTTRFEQAKIKQAEKDAR